MKDIFQTKMAVLTLLILPIFFIISCKKFLEIDPPSSRVVSDAVFASDPSAVSAATGIYHGLSGGKFASGAFDGTVNLAALSAGELTYNYAGRQDLNMLTFEENNLSPDNNKVSELWKSLYKSIYQCNSLLDGLSSSTAVTQPIKQQLQGEALFVRAFCYFYAVNLFGDVPVVTTTDPNINSQANRSPVSEVYQLIVSDLLEAKDLLREEYIRNLNLPAMDRVRVNKYAAAALLARVYLYQEEWVKAEAESSLVIDNTGSYGLNTDLDKVFLASTSSNINKEVVWQLMPVNLNYATNEGDTYIITDANYNFTISDHLLGSFESGDERRNKWISNYTGASVLYYPFKYKLRGSVSSVTEYSMVLRLGEQYLIRAEARARLGNLGGSISDVDLIRNRAALSLFANTNPGIGQADLLLAIERERQIELFAEWGHRWLDLKRWNTATSILTPLKPGWQSTDVLYPLPQSDMDKNTNLRPQNLGY